MDPRYSRRIEFPWFQQLVSDTRRWTHIGYTSLESPRISLAQKKTVFATEYEQMGRAVILGAYPYFSLFYEAPYLHIGHSVLNMYLPNVERRVSQFQKEGYRRLSFFLGSLSS